MTSRPSIWLGLALAALCWTTDLGCTLILDTDSSQCTTNADCFRFRGVCDQETRVCKPEVIVSVEPASPPTPAARPDADTAPRDAGAQDARSGTTGGPGAGARDASGG